MLNKLFFSKKAHRILTALFWLGICLIYFADKLPLVAGLFGIFYPAFYVIYFFIRFIWRIFNKPDINQYEIDKMKMSREQLMDKYGVYRP